MKFVTSALIFVAQLVFVLGSDCHVKEDLAGKISSSSSYYGYDTTTDCWVIKVPRGSFAKISIEKLYFGRTTCSLMNLKIQEHSTSSEYEYCYSDINKIKNPITAFNDVTVTRYAIQSYDSKFELTLQYQIQDIKCIRPPYFRCDNHSCIEESQQCDGVQNCVNGADEKGCEKGILAISEIAEVRKNLTTWLIKQRGPSWGWKEDTNRAMTALHLAGSATNNRSNLEEELMAKQTQLMASVALQRDSITDNKLSMHINALLVTCHDPRNFYGRNLVTMLESRIQSSINVTHPVAYLALCNANETWPSSNGIADLNKILDNESEYPFMKEIQAQAVMALSCIQSTTNLSQDFNSSSYRTAIRRFKEHQLEDGSFGNVYSTAWITQALIASGEELSKDWKLNATIKYLRNALNSEVDFLAAYLILPILNGKSLVNVSNVNCTNNQRKHDDGDILSDLDDYMGPKINVQYSLYVGDEKDVIHTMSLRVPMNFTALEVMTVAAAIDKKYKFSYTETSSQAYVYQIDDITNDAENGQFWLLYIARGNDTQLTHSTKSPNQLILEDNDKLVMWFKTAQI